MAVNRANAIPAQVITAVNAAADTVAMPPPPPLDVLRRRGPPPVPKVPHRQAVAFLALAKVPSGAGAFIHAGTAAWVPNLAPKAQGQHLRPAGRIVHVAAIGGPPPTKGIVGISHLLVLP